MPSRQGSPTPSSGRSAARKLARSASIAGVAGLLSLALASQVVAEPPSPTSDAPAPTTSVQTESVQTESVQTGRDVAEFPPEAGHGVPRAIVGPNGERPAPTSRGARSDAVASPAVALDSREAFILAAGEAARASMEATGVPASVTIAQAILESDWGKATIRGANNYFGIKATSGPGPAGVVWAQTREFANGIWITIQAPFRAYNSMAESFTDHGQFLAQNERYARAFEHADDPQTFAKLIHQAGYATDPNYSKSLIALMDRYDLYRFDTP